MSDSNPNNIANTGKVAIYDASSNSVDVDEAPAAGIKSPDDLLAMAKSVHRAAGLDADALTMLAGAAVTDRGAWVVIRDAANGAVLFAHTL